MSKLLVSRAVDHDVHPHRMRYVISRMDGLTQEILAILDDKTVAKELVRRWNAFEKVEEDKTDLADVVKKVVLKRLSELSWCCRDFCSKVKECEENPSTVTDWEPRYCRSIIEAAFGEGVTFDVPFPHYYYHPPVGKERRQR